MGDSAVCSRTVKVEIKDRVLTLSEDHDGKAVAIELYLTNGIKKLLLQHCSNWVVPPEEYIATKIIRLEQEFWAANGLGHPNLLLIGRVPYGQLDMHCKGMTVVLSEHPVPLKTYRGLTVVPVLDDHYLAVAKGVAP